MSYHEQVAKSRERFEQETAEHEMTVLRDDGLYRHLRFQRPGTSIYWFDLVTWPGRLVICGDCGDFMFSRLRDMFEFFGPDSSRGGFEDARWGINPGYWSEKMPRSERDSARTYSYEAFRARVGAWLDDAAQDLPDDEAAALRKAVDEQLLDDWLGAVHSEHEARRLLHEFEHEGRYIDSSEWDLREYDWQFLWCCWAIVWGIGKYRVAHQREVATA